MKHYTVQEANELLPFLAPTLLELRDKFDKAVEIKDSVMTAAATNGGSTKREKWSKTLARVQELLERLAGWGLEVRDVESGLVDFPSIVDGREAFLCWKLGEASVAHWHLPGEGFGSRRPL